jgi:hypothetical protein
MSQIKLAIKTALENTVLCRGANGPKESYEYAEKMESYIKKTIIKELDSALETPELLESKIKKIIEDLEK